MHLAIKFASGYLKISVPNLNLIFCPLKTMAIPTFAKTGKTYLEIVGLDGNPIDYVPDNMLFEVDDFDIGTKEALVTFVRKCEYWQCKLPKLALDAACRIDHSCNILSELVQEFGGPNFSTRSIELVFNNEIIVDEEFSYCLAYKLETNKCSGKQHIELTSEYIRLGLVNFLKILHEHDALPESVNCVVFRCNKCEQLYPSSKCPWQNYKEINSRNTIRGSIDGVTDLECVKYLHSCGFSFTCFKKYKNKLCLDYFKKVEAWEERKRNMAKRIPKEEADLLDAVSLP